MSLQIQKAGKIDHENNFRTIQIKVISRVQSSLISVGEYAADFHFCFESSIPEGADRTPKNVQGI